MASIRRVGGNINENLLRSFFDFYDTDRDSRLSKEQVEQALQILGLRVDEEIVIDIPWFNFASFSRIVNTTREKQSTEDAFDSLAMIYKTLVPDGSKQRLSLFDFLNSAGVSLTEDEILSLTEGLEDVLEESVDALTDASLFAFVRKHAT